ncbi:MAG: N-6 DNA methylase [Thermodesulfobacteriota bacterium]
MEHARKGHSHNRYGDVSHEKSQGATYTPDVLANFVAKEIVGSVDCKALPSPLRVLDPAVGDGQLLMSLVGQLCKVGDLAIEVYGFEMDSRALETAERRLKRAFGNLSVRFKVANFLDFVLDQDLTLFAPETTIEYDLVIANPPYVRTQILGAGKARNLAKQFGLSGRVDLYFPFVLAIVQVLKPTGIAGIIVSNRFMTTKAGAPLRKAIREVSTIRHIWDLGDTKLFDAAVLPAVLLLEGRTGDHAHKPHFTTIYETTSPPLDRAANPIAALAKQGVVEVDDGRRFEVLNGILEPTSSSDAVWRISTREGDAWLATVRRNTWGSFRDIGKIRVGVKTCADQVFIRSDWQHMPENERPELLRPVVTHHIARRFRSVESERPRQILYPHESINATRRTVDLAKYPRAKAYLERYREVLEQRRYVTEAGREWYEIWVPQDPSAWDLPKLVFRDIAEKPTFWVDLTSAVVNGDCYWLLSESPRDTDLLWLAAAVGNSTFIEKFYDNRFQNKLYAGRRRFMTQYVEKFPLPDPESRIGRTIIDTAKEVYESVECGSTSGLEERLDTLVWQSFGLVLEEVRR